MNILLIIYFNKMPNVECTILNTSSTQLIKLWHVTPLQKNEAVKKKLDVYGLSTHKDGNLQNILLN